MTHERLSKEAWMDFLKKPFTVSMDRVHEAITNHRAVQDWIQEDILESTLNVEAASNVEEAAGAYRDMMTALEERFPTLIEAVAEMTQGCGQLDIDWRPLAPQFTGLYINFQRDVEVDRFIGLDELTPDSIKGVIDRLTEALPKSDPFPNRPNEVTGVVAYRGRCVVFRAQERLVDPGQRKTTYAIVGEKSDLSVQLSRSEVQERLKDALERE